MSWKVNAERSKSCKLKAKKNQLKTGNPEPAQRAGKKPEKPPPKAANEAFKWRQNARRGKRQMQGMRYYPAFGVKSGLNALFRRFLDAANCLQVQPDPTPTPPFRLPTYC